MIRGRALEAVAGIASCVLLLLGACRMPSKAPSKPEIERSYGNDTPGTLTLRVSTGSLRAADELTLEVEARAAAGWSASLPEIADAVGQFTVVGRSAEERRRAVDGTVTLSQTYRLEPFLPGAYSIPALSGTFESIDGLPYAVESDEIPVEVTSALPPQLGEQDIEGMAPPLGMPTKRPLWVGLGGGALLLAAGSGALALRHGIRRKTASLTAGDAAMAELERLLAAGLVAQGRFEEFYLSISGIARRYVERRFAVRAPRQTTEEFLAEAARHESLRGHAELLQGFLSACDLVKFARHAPSGEEVGLAVGACRTFIAETAREKPAVESAETVGEKPA